MTTPPYRFARLITIKEGHTTQECIRAWAATAYAMQQESGALGTELFVLPSNQLLIVSIWTSEEAYEAAKARWDATDRLYLSGDTMILEPVAKMMPLLMTPPKDPGSVQHY